MPPRQWKRRATLTRAQRLTYEGAGRPMETMAKISDFTIVTYERAPGHWRAAFTPKRLPRSVVRGVVHSTVTPDCATDSQANLEAEQAIRNLDSVDA
jgi:hypothetical protein